MEAQRVLWINAGGSAELNAVAAPWHIVCRPPAAALKELQNWHFDAILLDFPLPPWTPIELLESIKSVAPETPILIRHPEATISDAVRWAHMGAYQVLSGGEEPSGLLDHLLADRTGRQAGGSTYAGPEEWASLLVGTSPAMRRVYHIIRMVGSRRATVLITGETGTGKEVAARALHQASPRRGGPLVSVNCSALPETLLEAELFGHVRGAFTGAVQTRAGRFEQAHNGTLFLDEIGEMPADLQAKLLRVLQEREFERLGSSETVRVDIRVVAATNCDLARKIEQGTFREDLYYRLNVVPLHLPPLRQRRGDIALLAAHFAAKICGLERLPLKTVTAEAVARLSGYAWPGNVRQLENAVEVAIAMSGDRLALAPSDFPLAAPARFRQDESRGPLVSLPDTGLDYEQTLAVIERSILEQALERTGGNKKAAADMLGLKRTTLSAKVRSLAPVAVCE
ncbi:MAG TPA: sigma-54 dependent transcriptional regulator [Bryobacteraceae bacterium]|jgi:DNA-binding NtrC family response regulator|nr:sigma-54 dependent transcriptional regulator [Bryobacteraceae bacterium]